MNDGDKDDHSITYKFFYVNINGLSQNKIENSDLLSDAKRANFICLTETHLKYENEISDINQYQSHSTYSKGNSFLGRKC